MNEKRPEASLRPPWGEHDLPQEETLSIRVGPLELFVHARGDEVWVASRPGDWRHDAVEPIESAAPTTEDHDWVRWPVPGGTGRISLSPVLPPRTVVLEPELAFRLLPSTEARIYVRVPLWVRVAIATTPEMFLVEVPTLTLSDTWWGDVTEGELCYWLPTTARRRVEDDTPSSHLVVCPLQLQNESKEELEVREISLRVAHLTVFSSEGRFWADETSVRYRGESEGSSIEMSGRSPAEAPSAVEVTAPRSPIPRGLTARTFARLKSLPGLVDL